MEMGNQWKIISVWYDYGWILFHFLYFLILQFIEVPIMSKWLIYNLKIKSCMWIICLYKHWCIHPCFLEGAQALSEDVLMCDKLTIPCVCVCVCVMCAMCAHLHTNVPVESRSWCLPALLSIIFLRWLSHWTNLSRLASQCTPGSSCLYLSSTRIVGLHPPPRFDFILHGLLSLLLYLLLPYHLFYFYLHGLLIVFCMDTGDPNYKISGLMAVLFWLEE